MTSFPFQIVGFDLDGTLLDSLGDLGHAVNHALAIEGRRAVPREEVRGFVGGGARKMLANALVATGGPVDDARFEELHDALLAFYEANIAVETCLFPGGAQMLDALAARGVKIAVVTNKLERFAKKIFAELGLSHRFYTVIGGDTLGPGRAKPRPDLLHLMLERGGEGRAAYVGDTTYDTRAAAAAGLPCIAVSFGFNDMPPADLGAAAVIDHFDQLVPVLEKIGNNAGPIPA
ncbi:HAD-IA family hydrolase [Novosphingobium guangzhouense]|uniref:phosphoglycolate phosphatase n=1 Tax=Novosphingobium guangzhouense TaxID=1850347 RepID=A0A2K2G425_9SPHN|nr:HAD-IA family hydrolase [Novosphingobium guangzhouense]PNU05771.1 phosphoglycolate phosphatase [Novosphingobium guangzhouense]